MNPQWPDFEDCVRDFHPTAVGKGYKPPPPPPPPPPPEMDKMALAEAERTKAEAKAAQLKKRGRAQTLLGGIKEQEDAKTDAATLTGE